MLNPDDDEELTPLFSKPEPRPASIREHKIEDFINSEISNNSTPKFKSIFESSKGDKMSDYIVPNSLPSKFREIQEMNLKEGLERCNSPMFPKAQRVLTFSNPNLPRENIYKTGPEENNNPNNDNNNNNNNPNNPNNQNNNNNPNTSNINNNNNNFKPNRANRFNRSNNKSNRLKSRDLQHVISPNVFDVQRVRKSSFRSNPPDSSNGNSDFLGIGDFESEKESLKGRHFMRDDYFFENHSQRTNQVDIPSMMGKTLDSDDSFKILYRYSQWRTFCRKMFHLGKILGIFWGYFGDILGYWGDIVEL